MASLTINLTYTDDILCSTLKNVSNNKYKEVKTQTGLIETDTDITLDIHYKTGISSKYIYILYLYRGCPHSSYINVYKKNIFKGNVITLKDIVKTFMNADVEKQYSYKNNNLRINITYDSDDDIIVADEYIMREYKNYNSDSDSDNDSDSDSESD
jgi:hypothetical protein